MTDKTEAQPEALRLATLLDVNYHEPYVEQAAATELRRQHAEIARLRALAATCYAGLGGECDLPVEWLDALNDAASGEPFDTDGLLPYTSAIRAQLTIQTNRITALEATEKTYFDQLATLAQREIDLEVELFKSQKELKAQTNRAAAAEQQVTALTQRLDMANRLHTDAREQLAQQAASERLAKAFPQAAEMFHPLYVQGFKAGYRRGGARGKRSVLRQVGKLMDEVITMSPPPAQSNMVGLRQIKPAPAEQSNSVEFEGIKTPPPEREPKTHEENRELAETAMRFVDRAGDVHPGIDDAGRICSEFHAAMMEVIEKWHPMPTPPGIGATND